MKRAFVFFLLMSASVACAQNITSPRAILRTVEEMVADDIERWCADAGLAWPPSCTVLRVFKAEGECEIWSGNRGDAPLKLVTTVPICAVDREPGPKLKQGDGKTPEGFFGTEFHFSSRRWWMWMQLSEDRVDEPGVVDRGSCFKIFVDYPLAVDRCATGTAGFSDPGGAIFFHGNCVTAGCISFKNRNFLPVFAFGRHHDQARHGPMQAHIFPFRFDSHDDTSKRALARSATHADVLGFENVLRFWENLEQGFDAFNRMPAPLDFRRLGVRVFRVGDVSPVVRDVKAALAADSLYVGTVDGVFSADLKPAVVAFQRMCKLQADGVIGPQTLGALGLFPCRYVF